MFSNEARPPYMHPQLGVMVLSRYDDVRTALRDWSTEVYDLAIGSILGPNLLAMGGDGHRALRDQMSMALRGKSLRDAATPIIHHHARELAAAPPNDLVADFCAQLPARVIADLLGLPLADVDQLRAWSKAILALIGNLTTNPAVSKAGLDATGELRSYLGEDRFAVTVLLLLGGVETSEKGLASHLRDRLDGLDITFDQSLDRSPPFRFLMRTSPEGVHAICLLAAAHADPERPEGAPSLAFGAGAHFCMGAQLARLEADISVSTLFAAHPTLRYRTGFRPTDAGIFTRGPRELLVIS